MAIDRSKEGVIDCSKDEPRTQQSSRDECDINSIVAKCLRGADLSLFARSDVPQYGDFTNLPDYRTSLLMVNMARDMFMALPAELRFRFANDPAQLLDFLDDEKNRDEARKLGLLKPTPEVVVDPVLEEVKGLRSDLKSKKVVDLQDRDPK